LVRATIPRWAFWIPCLATAALIYGLSHQPDLGLPDRFPDWLAHAVEYGFFALTLVFALTRGFDPSIRGAGVLAGAVIIASLYGISDEWHQGFVGRDAAVSDWIADTIGAVIMVTVVAWVWRRMAASESRV